MRHRLKVTNKYLFKAFGDVMARKLRYKKEDRYRLEQWPKMLSDELINYSKAKDTRPENEECEKHGYGGGWTEVEFDLHGDIAWFAEKGLNISESFELIFLRSGALASAQAQLN